MSRVARIAPIFTCIVAALGCADPEFVPPPVSLDSGFDGQVVGIPGTRRDAGATDLGASDDAGAGCLAEPLDARVLFVLDRSDTMGEIAAGGAGLALNEVASTAAAGLLAALPSSSSAGLLLFPSQGLDEPDCAGVEALAMQFPFGEPSALAGTLGDLWSMEGLILGKPRARAMEVAAEALDEADLSDTLVVLFTDTAAGCVAGAPLDGGALLSARGARVLQVTLGTTTTATTFSTVDEVLDVLEPELDAVRRRCEAP